MISDSIMQFPNFKQDEEESSTSLFKNLAAKFQFHLSLICLLGLLKILLLQMQTLFILLVILVAENFYTHNF